MADFESLDFNKKENFNEFALNLIQSWAIPIHWKTGITMTIMVKLEGSDFTHKKDFHAFIYICFVPSILRRQHDCAGLQDSEVTAM
jgi:hypothetical protein